MSKVYSMQSFIMFNLETFENKLRAIKVKEKVKGRISYTVEKSVFEKEKHIFEKSGHFLPEKNLLANLSNNNSYDIP